MQDAVIKVSICTGEAAAGFRRKADRKFTEVMLIRSEADKEQFMQIYGLEKVDAIY